VETFYFLTSSSNRKEQPILQEFFEALYSSFVANTLQEMGSFSFPAPLDFFTCIPFFLLYFVPKGQLEGKSAYIMVRLQQ